MKQQMEWKKFKDIKPTAEGKYIIHAESEYPDLPFIHTAWYNNKTQKWEMLPEVWARSVTYWMELPNKPNL